MNNIHRENGTMAGPLIFTVPAYGFVMALYLDCLGRTPTRERLPITYVEQSATGERSPEPKPATSSGTGLLRVIQRPPDLLGGFTADCFDEGGAEPVRKMRQHESCESPPRDLAFEPGSPRHRCLLTFLQSITRKKIASRDLTKQNHHPRPNQFQFFS